MVSVFVIWYRLKLMSGTFHVVLTVQQRSGVNCRTFYAFPEPTLTIKYNLLNF